MKVHSIDREVKKHSGDPEWLEKHGKKAMEEYLALYPEKHQRRARLIFAKSMFIGANGGVFSAAPHWWRKPHSGPPKNDPFRAILGDIATGRSRTPGEVYTEVESVGSLKHPSNTHKF